MTNKKPGKFDVRNNSDEVLALKRLIIDSEFTAPGGRCPFCGMQHENSRGRNAGGHRIECPVRLLVYAPSCDEAVKLRDSVAGEMRKALAKTRARSKGKVVAAVKALPGLIAEVKRLRGALEEIVMAGAGDSPTAIATRALSGGDHG